MSLNFSDVPPFRDLGNITAMGVGYAFILSVLFLPALTAILPVRVKQTSDKKTQIMNQLAEFVIAKRKALLLIMGLFIVGLIAFVGQAFRTASADEESTTLNARLVDVDGNPVANEKIRAHDAER